MDNFIVWVTAALSGWLVTWKKKCTDLKKKRDGWTGDSMHECTKIEALIDKRVSY